MLCSENLIGCFRKISVIVLLLGIHLHPLAVFPQIKLDSPRNVKVIAKTDTSPKLQVPSPTVAVATTHHPKAFGQLPLSFELNRGQADEQVKFLSRGTGYSLFLTPSEVVLALTKKLNKKRTKKINNPNSLNINTELDVVRMKFVGGNSEPKIVGEQEIAGKSNYFRGVNPEQWKKDVPNYSKVRYESVYPNIDLIY